MCGVLYKEEPFIKRLLHVYSLVYYADLREDSIREIYPVEGADKSFSEVVKTAFSAGTICASDFDGDKSFFDTDALREKLRDEEFIEIKCRRKDSSGKYEWYLVTLSAVERSEHNVADAIVITFRNIDSLIRSEERQRKRLALMLVREEQYREALSSKATLYYNVNITKDLVEEDPLQNIIGETSSISEFLGFTPPYSFSTAVRKWGRMMKVENYEGYTKFFDNKCFLDAYERGERELYYEHWITLRDGKRIFLRQTVLLTKDFTTGDVQGFVYAHDITKEKEAFEKTIQNAEIINGLANDYDSVYFVNLDTDEVVVCRAKEARKRFFGDEEAFKGFKRSTEIYVKRLVADDDREMVRFSISRENIERELADKQAFFINFKYKGGKILKYYEAKIVNAGKIGSVRDILIGVADRDEEVRREKMYQETLKNALAQATQASKAKSIFLSNMSHDIRTPMNAIIGFTALAQKRLNEPEILKDYLDKVMTSSNHLLSLINDVLDMSRIESGKLRISDSECSLPEILHEIKNMVQTDVKKKNLDFIIRVVDLKNEDVFCDKLRLSQILINCVSNAVKFTPPYGMVEISVCQRPGVRENYACFEFVVKDTGIGMSKEFVNQIFEPFAREENTTISGIQGTGLGMAITKNLVDMMGGYISVKSEQNVKTEILVSLQLKLCDNSSKAVPVPEIVGKTILIADPDPETCRHLASVLKNMGIDSECISGTNEDFPEKKFAGGKSSFAGCIISWELGDKFAGDMIRKLRQTAGPKLPIIVITAYDRTDIEEEAVEAGADAFCEKPLFYTDIRNTLAKVFGTEIGQKKEEEKITFSGRRVLLVEDNEINREIAKHVLESMSLEVEEAVNGAIAVEMVAMSEPGYYDLVLMDIQMPVMDGYEATRQIRKLDDAELANVPIVAMTANAFAEDRRDAFEAGMNEHIVKPVVVSELMETIRKILKA
ncbi:MAG: response regulator [Clostridia bacterium]|nr:response regulator [Clostridia bacterium]